MSATFINSEVRPLVEKELFSGENLLWADKSYKLVLTLIEKIFVGFFIFWLFLCAVLILPSLFLGCETYRITINDVPTDVSFTEYLLFVSIFPATGIGMIAFVLVLAKIRTGHVFAVTNTRSLIISTFLMHRVTSILHSPADRIERSGKEEFGTIKFQREWMRQSQLNLGNMFEMSVFSGIQNPRKVEELILSLQKKEK